MPWYFDIFVAIYFSGITYKVIFLQDVGWYFANHFLYPVLLLFCILLFFKSNLEISIFCQKSYKNNHYTSWFSCFYLHDFLI